MKAYRSNIEKESCTPTSSNCVVWQGPDLPCLNLCKGDSISDVTYKLAVEVCDLQDSIGISGVDLSNLVNVCLTSPEPTKTLTNILNLLITKVICIDDLIKNLPPPGTNYIEPSFDISQYTCLVVNTGAGTTLNNLTLSEFTQRIAGELCTVSQSITDVTGQIAQNTADIDLIKTTYYNSPNLPSFTSCLTNTSATIDLILKNLETEFCDYTTTLGSVTSITTSIQAQCDDLANKPQLSGNTKYPMSSKTNASGSITWKTPVTTLADAFTNLWLTVCDMRDAVYLMQQNCCKVDCDSIKIDFDYKWVDQNTIKLYFFSKSNLPAGFYDCGDAGPQAPGPGNILTLTDGLGNEMPVPMHFRYNDPTNFNGILDDYLIAQNGYVIDLSNGPIDSTTGVTITGNVCFTDGSTSCIKCVTKTAIAYNAPIACCTITATSDVTIIYRTCSTTTTTLNPNNSF